MTVYLSIHPSSLLKATLLEWTSKMERGQKLSQSELAEQRSMLRVLNRIWCQQEEERRKAKAEEESLYVTRSVLFAFTFR